MKSILALTKINLRLAMRERSVLVFNYIFPLIFFFAFSTFLHAASGAITQIVTMVLVIGIMGSGLFGAGIRAVADREANILRRYKVAPITPLPIVLSSMITGFLLYLPSVFLIMSLAVGLYGMAIPQRWLSLLMMVSLGALAFRGIGMIIAAVANSMGESNILVQMMYMPMLFLSGATFPLVLFPNWLQIVANFLPATYLLSGMQGVLLQNESLAANGKAAFALIVALTVATFVATKLFRWEKEEKLPRSSKLWLLVVLAPFLILGTYQAYSKESIGKSRQLERTMSRNRARLIRNVRVFVGDGTVIENGAVLFRNGRIEEIYTDNQPTAESVRAEPVEANGKTLLPGLIDAHVHLGNPGGVYADPKDYQAPHQMERALAQYLYSGVTAVRSVGDPLDAALTARQAIRDGAWTGAELSTYGPLFTAPGGHGTEYSKYMPAQVRAQFDAQFTRLPKTSDEARQQVTDLKARGVDGIKAILEAGAPGMLFNRLDINLLRGVADGARAAGLPLAIHTGDVRDVADALAVQPASIEHGTFREALPDELLARWKQAGTYFDPTLSVADAFMQIRSGKLDALNRTLVQQVAPKGVIAATKKALTGTAGAGMRSGFESYPVQLPLAMENLKRAHAAGVPLVMGTDSGNMLLIHGPAIHRELQLWVQAGIPAAVALQAATGNAAKLLRTQNQSGFIRKGMEATLLLVDGNPLQDISVTERIAAVYLKGERIDRADLFEQH